jgi:hypothetical protein
VSILEFKVLLFCTSQRGIKAGGQMNTMKLYLQQKLNVNIDPTWPQLIFLDWAGINNNAAVGSCGSKHGSNPAEPNGENLLGQKKFTCNFMTSGL